MSNTLWRFLFSLIAITAVTAAPAAPANGKLSDDPDNRLSTIPHDPAMQAAIEDSGIKVIAIQHEGWPETLPSFARVKLEEITGRTRIHGQDPSYSILSMIYLPHEWENARILPVEHPRLLETLKLDNKWVTPKQITDNPLIGNVLEELRLYAADKAELDRTRKLLNAVEQANRLGREERVLTQMEADGISGAEVRQLLDDGELLSETHVKLREMEAKVSGGKAYANAAQHLLARVQAFGMLSTELLLVPDSESVENNWIRPVSLGRDGPLKIADAGRTFDRALASAFVNGTPDVIAPATSTFLDIVQRSRYYPTENFRRAQNIYVQSNPYRIAAWIYLLTACVFGLFIFFRNKAFYWSAIGLIVIGFLIHSTGIGLRLYLTGRIPVANMFEAITFCSGSIMLIAIVAELITRKALVGIGAAVVSFLLLTGAGLMPLYDTRLHPLRAVLNSYWLNIHVTMMLVSYAAFAIAAFFALVYIIRTMTAREARIVTIGGGATGALCYVAYLLLSRFGGFAGTSLTIVNYAVNALEITLILASGILLIAAALAAIGYTTGLLFGKFATDSEMLMTLPQTEQFAYRLVQLGWPILTVGITLGGVWADTAWGRFWGWDPKETWAFITWVAFTVYLHMRMVMGWRGRWSAAACLIGFVMVLITWLGVSYLPWFSGGLHSYASPT